MSVTVDQDATITTTGMNTPGIIAQSVGGGGGWITNKNGAYVGSAGGTGTAGFISVTVNGVVDAQGQASPGIFVQSAGGASNHGSGNGDAAYIYIGSRPTPMPSLLGAAISATPPRPSSSPREPLPTAPPRCCRTTASSTRMTSRTGRRSTALPQTSWAKTTGSITGNLHIAHGGVTNYGSGTVHPFSAIDLAGGDFVNHGTLDLTSGPAETLLTGNYIGEAGSTIALSADFLNGTSDHLTVTGDATVGSRLVFQSPTLVPTTVTVLTAGGSLGLAGVGAVPEAPVFRFAPQVSGNSLAGDAECGVPDLGAQPG